LTKNKETVAAIMTATVMDNVIAIVGDGVKALLAHKMIGRIKKTV
jgi:hypothetical protein